MNIILGVIPFTDLEAQLVPDFKGYDTGQIINALIPYIFVVAGLLLLIYLLYGGFHLIISGGDPKGIQEARNKITFALVGFIVVFISYWLVLWVGKMFGLDGFGGAFGN